MAIIEHKDLKARLDQALAELDAAKARLQRVHATGPKEVARARADVREDEAIGELAAINLKRQKDMRQSDLVAEQAYDQAHRDLVAQAALGLSLSIALAFGLAPAKKAANLLPVNALRE